MSDLKLVEAGLAKETKALLSVPLIPISILLPIFVSRWTAGRRPLRLYAKAFATGMIVTGIIGVMVWVTGTVKDSTGNFPGWYFPALLLVECAYKVNGSETVHVRIRKGLSVCFFADRFVQQRLVFQIWHSVPKSVILNMVPLL